MGRPRENKDPTRCGRSAHRHDLPTPHPHHRRQNPRRQSARHFRNRGPMKAKRFALAAIMALAAVSHADVKLPKLISDHMVLQRDTNAPVWGLADPGEKVTVNIAGQTHSAVADKDGRWRI